MQPWSRLKAECSEVRRHFVIADNKFTSSVFPFPKGSFVIAILRFYLSLIFVLFIYIQAADFSYQGWSSCRIAVWHLKIQILQKVCTLRLKVKDLKPIIIMSMADCTCVMQPPFHRCRMNVVFALGNMCVFVCELEQACRQTGWLPTARRCCLVVLNSLLYAWIAAPSQWEHWHASRRDWALSFTLSSSHSRTHLWRLISSKFPLQEYYWSCSAFWEPASYYFLISLVSKDTLTQRRISENWKEKKIHHRKTY